MTWSVLISKISYQSANPRDLIAFKSSLEMLPAIRCLLDDFQCDLLKEIQADMDPLQDLYELVDQSIMDEPPLTVRDGDMIKTGFHEEVDRLRNAKTEGKTWIAQLEAKEREATGIKNLRIKYNKVFGYYLEVTNSYKVWYRSIICVSRLLPMLNVILHRS